MTDSRWEQAKDIFQAALERPPREREQFLSEACGADGDLLDEVCVLLDSFEEAGDFLDEHPIGEVAETIVGKQENLEAGQKLGRYKIIQKLGAGGMGEVFLAEDGELERLVALKILFAAFSGNEDRVRRFVQEAKAVSALNHPNILTIYEIGQSDNLRFIVTEHIKGETLRERQRREPLNLNEILEIAAQAAAALNAAHSAGIVHRDIKPENIMVREDGLVKVLDFGLAKLIQLRNADCGMRNEGNEILIRSSENNPQSAIRIPHSTTPGLVMGTVAYMSPEQTRGMRTDARTDVWSLGVCLYEMLTGVQPFAGETTSDAIAAILKSEPAPPDENVPLEFWRIVEKCLQKNVAERYQTITDFLGDVKNLKKELELSEELGVSSVQSAKRKNLAAGQSNGRVAASGQREFSAQNSFSPRASSAEYVVSGVRKHKLLSFGVLGILAAALAAILYFSFFNELAASKSINSLAVLPFANIGSDENSEYISDGLSESLINNLSQIPQLKVIARSSAFKYKGKDVEPQEAARALGVQAIVTGRVVRRGDDLQISVELINAADNRQIWGETYRRKVADVQAIQDEITQTIVQKLRLKLSGNQTERVAAPSSINSQAYQLYLNGVFYRRKNGDNNIEKAIELQKQAIALDPNFALAYVELAINQYNLVAIGSVGSQTGLPPVREATEKALSLDENLADAHDMNASLKAAEFDWTGAEAEFRRALELNPNLATARTSYAGYLSDNGRFDEALREIKRAQELDPLRAGLVGNEGIILLHARRYDEALVIFERDDPDMKVQPYPLIYLARAYAAKGRYADAIAALQKSLVIGETPTALIHLGRVYALAGERGEALRVLDRLEKTDKYVSPAESTIFYAALGMREQAFGKLEQGFAERDVLLSAIKTAPEYDSLRDDPRFLDLLQCVGLPK